MPLLLANPEPMQVGRTHIDSRTGTQKKREVLYLLWKASSLSSYLPWASGKRPGSSSRGRVLKGATLSPEFPGQGVYLPISISWGEYSHSC